MVEFPVLLTAGEIAERWSCHRMTVFRSRLSRYVISGSVRFALGDVERFERDEFGYVFD